MAIMLFAGLSMCSNVWAQHTPNGSFDICTGYGGYITVQGWAFDPDVPAKSISVRVDIYTNSNCTNLYKSVTLKANKARADVNNKYHITGQHGFKSNIDINATGTYWAKVTAIDETGDANTVKGPETATVTSWVEINSSNAPTTWGEANTVTTYKVTGDLSYDKVIVKGDVTLWLGEGTTLTAQNGILVAAVDKLTIDGTGSLVAIGNVDVAGIGADGDYDPLFSGCGEIVINNGHITATAEYEAAAIGGAGWGCYDNSSCKITINGGVIFAKAGQGAAAIGGGMAISNYDYYLGFGGGDPYTFNYLLDTDGMPGTVVINGGQVTAIAEPTVCAIGRGAYATGNSGSIRLGWTDSTDFIYATRLDAELLTIADGKTFIIDETGVEANANNLATFSNNTLRPNVVKLMSQATVSGIYSTYTYRGESFMPTYTVTDAFGYVLTEGTDFTVNLTFGDAPVTQLNDLGSYKLTLTGTGQYAGTQTFDIEVLDFTPPALVSDVEFESNAIRQTAYSATSATLEWNTNPDITDWKIEYSKDYHFDPAIEPVHELTVSGSPTVTITGLEPETSYYARVKAIFNGVESDWGGRWDTYFSHNGSTRFETTEKKWIGYDKIEHSYISGDECLPYYTCLGHFSNHPCDQSTSWQIYTADEISQAGVINSLSFRMELYRNYRNYDIYSEYLNWDGVDWTNIKYYTRHIKLYLVHTDKSNFISREDTIPYTEADLVWEGIHIDTPDTWNTFTLDTPFNYDGTHNLAVILWADVSSHCVCQFRSYHTDTFQSTFSDDYKHYYGTNKYYQLHVDGRDIGQPLKNQIRLDISSVDLADQTDNSSVISDKDGETQGIILNDRTIYRDGDWNTLCLPFNIGDANAANGHHYDGTELEGATVMELNNATSDMSADGKLTLNFTEAACVKAGKPYIVKWNPETYKPQVQHRYYINSEEDWNNFANNPNVDAVLTADITVSTVAVGFSRTFDGNGHTITFNCGSANEPHTDFYLGLFKSINGATIKNLHVTGSFYIYDWKAKYAGGMIGQAIGNCTITNCQVSTNITCIWKKDHITLSSGGIIGIVEKNSNVDLTNCLYDGQLNGSGFGMDGNKGFVGFLRDETSTVSITRSLFDPAAITVLPDYGATFAIGANHHPGYGYDDSANGTAIITDCYYTQPLGLPQGIDASGMSPTELAAALGSQWTVRGNKVVPALTPGYSYINWTNPEFGLYQIVGDSPTAVEFEGGKFIGTYSPFADTSARLIGNRNEGNRGFRAAISLDGYTVDWYLNEERTIPATTIPFDPNTGQVVLYLDKTKNTAELEALNSGSSVEDLETNWANKTVEVSFTRSFTQNVASTICLPYPMTEIPAGGSVYEFVDVQKEAGVWVATMRDATPDNNIVTATVAGKPYLYMPSATGEVIFTGSVEVPENVTAGSSTSDANDGTWTFRGTYRRLAYKADGSADLDGSVFGFASASKEVDGKMVNAGEFVKAKDGAGVPAFRAYLTYEGTNNAFRAPIRGIAADAGPEIPDRITVRLLGKDGTVTAVGTMNTTTGDVKIEQWFDMQGRPVDGTPALPGTYINNIGSKIMIR